MGISILAWLSSLNFISSQYGCLGMITRPIWKCPCNNLYLYKEFKFMVINATFSNISVTINIIIIQWSFTQNGFLEQIIFHNNQRSHCNWCNKTFKKNKLYSCVILVRVGKYFILSHSVIKGLGLGLWCLMPLSTLFQLNRGG